MAISLIYDIIYDIILLIIVIIVWNILLPIFSVLITSLDFTKQMIIIDFSQYHS